MGKDKMKYETVVLIPNFNGKEHLEDCLSSLLKQSYKKLKIVIIDNNSKDGSIEFIEKRFPLVEIIRLNNNYGFAVPMNIGMKHAIKKYNPKYIVWANNDIKAEKDCIKNLIKTAEKEKNAAAVTGNILYFSAHEKIYSQGGTQTIYGKPYPINGGKLKEEGVKKMIKVFFPIGALCLIKVESLKEIGLFDERYFAYCEDSDWGWTANVYGYDIIFEPKSVCYHKSFSTSGKNPHRTDYDCKKNMICNYLKNLELKHVFLFTPYLTAYFIMDFWDTLNRKYPKRLGTINFVYFTFKAFFWNLWNIKETLKKRKIIQSKRKIKDKSLFYLMGLK